MNIKEFQDSLNNITFYDAVKLGDDGAAYMDMVKARSIWMCNLKRIRNVKLEDLDIKSLMALEMDDQVALSDVLAKKKVLRDMKNTYDLSDANTWQELLTMIPDYLL